MACFIVHFFILQIEVKILLTNKDVAKRSLEAETRRQQKEFSVIN